MKLIPEWKQIHKFWSVRLQVAGMAILAFVQEFPDVISQSWLVLPTDIRATLPENLIQWLGYACLALGIFARIVLQTKLQRPGGNGADKAL